MAIDEKLIDKRIVQRSIKKGLVTAESVQEYLRGLPDKGSQAEASHGHDAPERSAPGGTGG